MIEKIVAKLKLVFDKVTAIEDTNGLTVTVDHKGKQHSFIYKKGTYEGAFNLYDDNACFQQARGMAGDCIIKFMEG